MSAAPQRPGPVERVRGAVDVLYREMIKFGVVGAVAFVVDMGTFNLLRRTVFTDKPTAATVVSALLATFVAWIGNRVWTFRRRRSRPASHEALLFAVTNGVALLIQAGAVAFSHYVLGIQSLAGDNAAKVVGIALGTLFRFWAYRTFVFAGAPDMEDVAGGTGLSPAPRTGTGRTPPAAR